MLAFICIIVLLIGSVTGITILGKRNDNWRIRLLCWVFAIIFVMAYTASFILVNNWLTLQTKKSIFIDKYNTAKKVVAVEKNLDPKIKQIIEGINNEIAYYGEMRNNVWIGIMYSKEIADLEPLDLP